MRSSSEPKPPKGWGFPASLLPLSEGQVPHQPFVEARDLRGFVEVVWTAPKNGGGSLITGYDIEVESTGRSYIFIGNPGTGYFLMASAAHTITAAHYISVRGRMPVFIAQSG